MQVRANNYTNIISYITMQQQPDKFAGTTTGYIIGSHQTIKITSSLTTRPCFHDLFRVRCRQHKVTQWSEDGCFISQTQPSIVGFTSSQCICKCSALGSPASSHAEKNSMAILTMQ